MNNASPLLRSVMVSSAFVAVTSCAPSDPVATDPDDSDRVESALATAYVELGDTLTGDDDLERWITLRRELGAAFDQVCGDTFCEGDYSNLVSLDFTCTVTQKRGRLHECAWTFAASEELVQGADGSIATRVPFFVCRVKPKGRADDLLTALGDDPLHAPLPGLSTSLYDALGDCFQHPVAEAPLPAPTQGPFADVADNLQGDEIDAWYAMTRAVSEDFADRCGDTFCEGDFTNLEPLRLRCSEDVTTKKIARCAWSFAGSDSFAKKSGRVGVTTGPATCAFTADATAAELSALLGPRAASESPLMRPLPGSSATLYDTLVDCL